jgi:hypothetical protein
MRNDRVSDDQWVEAVGIFFFEILSLLGLVAILASL